MDTWSFAIKTIHFIASIGGAKWQSCYTLTPLSKREYYVIKWDTWSFQATA